MNLERKYDSINLREKFSKLGQPWVAGIVAQFNEYQIKVVKIKGDYIWHELPHT